MAAGPLTPGGPTDLVTINPGSNTLGVLAGLGGGRFANPVALPTAEPRPGRPRGRLQPRRHPGPGRPHRQRREHLPGRRQGRLLAAGHLRRRPRPHRPDRRRRQPRRQARPARRQRLRRRAGPRWATATARSGPIARPTRPSPWPWPTSPATASPTSSTPTRGSTAWSSSTAPTRPTVLGDRSTGLLSPGAVKLADLNGDGIPDLIVANSGSNNVLVYPGLGNGQFGPAAQRRPRLLHRHQPDRHHGGRPQRPARPAGRQHRLQRRLDPAGPGQRVELDADPRAADQDRRRAGGRGGGQHPGHGPARPGRGQPAGQQRPGLPRRRRRVLQRPDARRPTPSARRPAGCSWATSTARAPGSRR